MSSTHTLASSRPHAPDGGSAARSRRRRSRPRRARRDLVRPRPPRPATALLRAHRRDPGLRRLGRRLGTRSGGRRTRARRVRRRRASPRDACSRPASTRGQPLSKLVVEGDVTGSGPRSCTLGNIDDAPATSVHVYPPPLRSMGFVQGASCRGRRRAPKSPSTTRPCARSPWAWQSSHPRTSSHAAPANVDPHEGARALHDGALLVDTRPASFRRAEGVIPGRWWWSATCSSGASIRRARTGSRRSRATTSGSSCSATRACAEPRVVSLHSLGLGEATDLIGGYRAWRLAGLPTVRAVEGGG